jgi:hypothetical protein
MAPAAPRRALPRRFAASTNLAASCNSPPPAGSRESISPATASRPPTPTCPSYGITDDGFRHIKGFTRLRQLGLRGIPIGGAGLDQLRGLDRLAVLRLNETGVDDDALRRLSGLNLKSLARLELRQTSVGDASVEHLQKLIHLRNLDVRQSGVSPSGVKRLAEALPKCKILD